MIYKVDCPLCKALQKEKDKYLYEASNFVILPTKKMKGHHKRIMIVYKTHVSYKNLQKEIECILINKFIQFSKKYFDEEPTFALVESTYATIPEHWHMIACDWFATPKEREQLNYTPHQSIKTKVKWKPMLNDNGGMGK